MGFTFTRKMDRVSFNCEIHCYTNPHSVLQWCLLSITLLEILKNVRLNFKVQVDKPRLNAYKEEVLWHLNNWTTSLFVLLVLLLHKLVLPSSLASVFIPSLFPFLSLLSFSHFQQNPVFLTLFIHFSLVRLHCLSSLSDPNAPFSFSTPHPSWVGVLPMPL